MRITGTPEEIFEQISVKVPEVRKVLDKCLAEFPLKYRTIEHYQAAPLYMLTKELSPTFIFEVGTFYGFSAGIMANAAPDAKIVTCNPKDWECEIARKCLEPYPNVEVVQAASWDLLGEYDSIDMCFVDGDHAQIVRDLPWWNYLNVGGLFFHHDYTPGYAESRPCQPVYDALNRFAKHLGHGPDVEIVDDKGMGMAGFYRLSNDPDIEVKQEWVIADG